MANLFVANPAALKAEGNKVVNQSTEFNKNVEKLYSTVEQLTSSSYVSPAAVAIANDIKSYREDLNKMTAVIRDYGNYLLHAGDTVMKNEQRIIDEIK